MAEGEPKTPYGTLLAGNRERFKDFFIGVVKPRFTSYANESQVRGLEIKVGSITECRCELDIKEDCLVLTGFDWDSTSPQMLISEGTRKPNSDPKKADILDLTVIQQLKYRENTGWIDENSALIIRPADLENWMNQHTSAFVNKHSPLQPT